MYDLDRQLVNGTGWQLSFANADQQCRTDCRHWTLHGLRWDHEQRAFLLTPRDRSQHHRHRGRGIQHAIRHQHFAQRSVHDFWKSAGSSTAALPKATSSNNQLPTNLGGTCVESDGTKWGLFFVSSGQVNVLAGTLPASGTVPVSVVTNCGTANEVVSRVVNVPVAPVSPEFLYFVRIRTARIPWRPSSKAALMSERPD